MGILYLITTRTRPFDTLFWLRGVVGETWDFGDGSPTEKVRSDANANPHASMGYAETVHRYAKAGHYLVKVEQVGNDGATVTARLPAHIEK